ncbi:aldehyde-activating protein [Methylosinus sp. R-45379]|uniref:GFA family protein n=1 Tax=Methylosinus sp. R-45379 TaxID=980563 RepID=UPI0007C8E0CE|nr:GFA family protein [Methylosinus sp. R-45379]OAI22599.1 aldehyde-activating protein [Methylosinus sp. R-45379]
MSDASYHGSCQCRAVTFEATLDLDHTITCNCSRCQRMGAVLSFTPAEKFRLSSGEDALGEYRFNTKMIAHRFCKICGIEPFAQGVSPNGAQMVAVNVNCLDGVDPRALASTHVDGRNV